MWLFRVREGRVARTDELASVPVFIDYDHQGFVLGVRLPAPPGGSEGASHTQPPTASQACLDQHPRAIPPAAA
jgi:hypothetical protein